MSEDKATVRLDKWLWAARFYKQRSLATEAINKGQVQVNGQGAKPSRSVRLNDEVEVQKAGQTWTVQVRGLSDKRGSATEAQALYLESAQSLERRQEQAEQNRAEWLSRPQPPGHRPDKRERRRLLALLKQN